MELLKAELIELKPGDPPQEVPDSSLPVQFNPTTLRLQISNQAEGGKAQGRPARQYIATSTVLSMDLVFDTADEGTSDEPRSVRERTAMVERFVLPKEKGTEAPPKLRFRWGDGLQFDGVVSSVNVDFDHFAANGVPLRAKVGLSLTEQDAKYQVVPAKDKANARQPGENKPGLPGSAGLSGGLSGGLAGGLSGGLGLSAGIGLSVGLSASFGFSASASLSLGGETAAGFSARMGLDPGAWRGLDVDLSGGLTLEAGVEVGFDASLNASTGLGASVGFGAGADAPAEASFGLKPDAAVSSGYSAAIGGSLDPQLGAGFALAAAGGVTSAVESVQIVRTTAAAEASREAFALPSAPSSASAAPARPGLPEQPRAPLALSGVPSPARQAAAPPAPRPPRVDPRAASFGFGVPLRPTVPTVPVDARPAPARKTRDEHHGRPCNCGCGGKR